MKGLTLAELSRRHGYVAGALRMALKRGPTHEWMQIVSEAIGVPAREIWPSRFCPENKADKGAQ
jgi:lambda repressor-like predicted transcriptional regulator